MKEKYWSVLVQVQPTSAKIILRYCQNDIIKNNIPICNCVDPPITTLLVSIHSKALAASVVSSSDQISDSVLTSSSLNQDRLSAVRTNQYSFAPPLMILMLLTVSQPLRMTCEEIWGQGWCQGRDWEEIKLGGIKRIVHSDDKVT